MFKRRPDTGSVDAAVIRGVDYEVTITELARRSERRAWLVAASATAITVTLAVACLAMLPLKERVPFLVMADASSGTASIARLDENFRNRAITASEAINRSNVAQFVTMREAYDLELINLHDWRVVHSMSAPEVGRAYSALHSKRNPASPYNIYGSTASIRTRILSIGMIDGPTGEVNGATVRFQRSIYDKRTGALQPLDGKIATLAFGYDLGLRMEERDRLQNPLGFRVTAYRVENDYAMSPPLAHDVAAVPPSTRTATSVTGDPWAAVDAGAASSSDAAEHYVPFPGVGAQAHAGSAQTRASDAALLPSGAQP